MDLTKGLQILLNLDHRGAVLPRLRRSHAVLPVLAAAAALACTMAGSARADVNLWTRNGPEGGIVQALANLGFSWQAIVGWCWVSRRTTSR